MASIERITRRNTHYYKVTGDVNLVDGIELPGATSIINTVIAKPWLTNWAVSQTIQAVEQLVGDPSVTLNPLTLSDEVKLKANRSMRRGAWIGEAVHEAINHNIRGIVSTALYPELQVETNIGLASFTLFQDDIRVAQGLSIRDTEVAVYYPAGFGGTIDCILQDSKKNLTICDWKTGEHIGIDAFLQMGAYSLALAYTEPDVKINAIIVQLGIDTPKYTAYHILNLVKYQELFITALTLYKGIKDFDIKKEV